MSPRAASRRRGRSRNTPSHSWSKKLGSPNSSVARIAQTAFSGSRSLEMRVLSGFYERRPTWNGSSDSKTLRATVFCASALARRCQGKGGLLGRPVELVYYDDQSNPSNVPGIYTKLINVDVPSRLPTRTSSSSPPTRRTLSSCAPRTDRLGRMSARVREEQYRRRKDRHRDGRAPNMPSASPRQASRHEALPFLARRLERNRFKSKRSAL
jgi:hypothetical protein